MNRNTAASQTTVNSSRASTPITFRLQNSSNLSIILASSDPCLFYGSWLVTWAQFFHTVPCQVARKTELSRVKREQAWSVPVGPCLDCHVFMVQPRWSSPSAIASLAETYLLSIFSYYLPRIPCWALDVLGSFMKTSSCHTEVFH